MEKALSYFQKMTDVLAKVILGLAAVIIGLDVLSIFLEVLGRYMVGSSRAFMEELPRILVPFVVFPMIGNNIVRATGDTFMPGMLMLSSAVINIILDPLLIFGIGPFPHMGIRGAALATVLARGVSFVFIMVILIKCEILFTMALGKVRDVLKTWKQVIYVAGPAALAMLIAPLSIGFITRLLSTYGKEAVAAFGVASRVEMLALMVIGALGSVLIIFIGQNVSKQKFGRIFTALKYARAFSLAWGALVFVLLLIFRHSIASIFTSDTRVISIAASYFLIVGSSYGFQGLGMLSMASFNGLNKPFSSMFFSMIRLLVLYVPLAWLGSKFFALNGIFWAGFTANIVAGILAFGFLYRSVCKMEGSCLKEQ